MNRYILPLIIISGIILLGRGIPSAEVYKWVDDKGAIHFTDDVNQIPDKYRPSVERKRLPEDSVENKPETDAPPKKDETYLDRSGRGEEYWRGRVEEWKKKINLAQEKLENLRNKYNDLNEKMNDSKSSVERTNLRKEREQIRTEMDLCRKRIDEAKNMLEKKIPEEADLFKAKREWIKQ